MLKELEPQHDRRKSFYRKAYEDYLENGDIKLYSYQTLVAEVKEGKLVVYNGWYEYKRYMWGQECWDERQYLDGDTTLRHIKEFAYQHGYGVLTKKDLKAMAVEV